MDTNYIIETKNLTKQYGSQKSVADLNIHVKRGRIYGLLGRNGAGKTTTMKMLLGLTKPTSGEVKIWGKSLQGHEKKLLPRIGSLIESPGFYPNLTGTENLRIFATLRGVPNNHAIKDALDLVGLPCKDKKLFSQYSLGMKQRLAIALAVMHDPSGVALLGLRTGIVSKLPQNELGTFIKNRIRFVGVSDDYLVYDDTPDARLGLYYYEMGAAPRKPTIVYDRHQASVTRIKMSEIPEDIYHSARMFHTSGISLALCQNMQNVAVELIRRFKSAGATISFDVNYRANLWGEEEARKTIEEILPLVDVLFVSEETSRRMFKKTGDLKDIMKSYATDYGVKIVATTQRTVISPRKHNFTSIVYDARSDKFYTEAPYNDIDVIDRIGSGDAYVAGVLFGLLKYGDPEKAMQFGNATSSVKNTVPGDLPSSDFKEIDRIIHEHHSTGPVSEMNR